MSNCKSKTDFQNGVQMMLGVVGGASSPSQATGPLALHFTASLQLDMMRLLRVQQRTFSENKRWDELL